MFRGIANSETMSQELELFEALETVTFRVVCLLPCAELVVSVTSDSGLCNVEGQGAGNIGPHRYKFSHR